MIRPLFGLSRTAGEDGYLTDEDLEGLYAPPASARHLRADMLASLDGAAEAGGTSSTLEAGEDDLRVFVTLRSLADVVIVGASTVRIENYGRVHFRPARAERRRLRGDVHPPRIAVVTNSADLNPGSKLFAVDFGREPPGQTEPIVITSEAAPADRVDLLREVAEVLVCGSERVDLAAAVDTLAGMGMRRQLCEGGPTLLSGLLAQGLVHELCLTTRWALAGPGRRRVIAGETWDGLVKVRPMMLLAGDDVLIGRYELTRR